MKPFVVCLSLWFVTHEKQMIQCVPIFFILELGCYMNFISPKQNQNCIITQCLCKRAQFYFKLQMSTDTGFQADGLRMETGNFRNYGFKLAFKRYLRMTVTVVMMMVVVVAAAMAMMLAFLFFFSLQFIVVINDKKTKIRELKQKCQLNVFAFVAYFCIKSCAFIVMGTF